MTLCCELKSATQQSLNQSALSSREREREMRLIKEMG